MEAVPLTTTRGRAFPKNSPRDATRLSLGCSLRDDLESLLHGRHTFGVNPSGGSDIGRCREIFATSENSPESGENSWGYLDGREVCSKILESSKISKSATPSSSSRERRGPKRARLLSRSRDLEDLDIPKTSETSKTSKISESSKSRKRLKDRAASDRSKRQNLDRRCKGAVLGTRSETTLNNEIFHPTEDARGEEWLREEEILMRG
ncbi:hypothetical protein KM043_004863 [Ampulex compressa]|nr:hypothetical protein KM043_004863 [Ampulex compressa]